VGRGKFKFPRFLKALRLLDATEPGLGTDPHDGIAADLTIGTCDFATGFLRANEGPAAADPRADTVVSRRSGTGRAHEITVAVADDPTAADVSVTNPAAAADVTVTVTVTVAAPRSADITVTVTSSADITITVTRACVGSAATGSASDTAGIGWGRAGWALIRIPIPVADCPTATGRVPVAVSVAIAWGVVLTRAARA
jgi:hypothetical protein